MSEHAKELWQQTRQNNTLEQVGDFFVEMVQKILGGETTSSNDPEDLHHYSLGAVIEVKSADNNHPHRLSKKEFLTDINTERFFPFDKLFYVFGCYKNRHSKKTYSPGRKRWSRRSLLIRAKSDEQKRSILIENTDCLYLLDSAIVCKMVEHFDLKIEFFGADRDDMTYGMLRRHFNCWTPKNARSLLTSLGLDPNDWVVSERKIRMEMYSRRIECPMEIRLVTVLPSDTHRRLGRVLRKRVKILKTRSSLQLNLL